MTSNATIETFSELGRRYGATPAGVGWSYESQQARFEMIQRAVTLQGCSLLDVGCGYGGLLDFLRAKQIECRYHGIDVVPVQIANAVAAHPDDARLFNVTSIDDLAPAARFDVVVAIGLLSLPTPAPYEVLEALLRKAFVRCRNAAIVTAISTRADAQRAGVQQYEPVKALAVARRIQRSATLDHSYLKHDFAIVVRRDGEGLLK